MSNPGRSRVRLDSMRAGDALVGLVSGYVYLVLRELDPVMGVLCYRCDGNFIYVDGSQYVAALDADPNDWRDEPGFVLPYR